MVTRREVVTAGALGALSTAAGAEAGTRTEAQNSDREAAEALTRIHNEVSKIREILDDGLRGPSVGFGIPGAARRQFELFIRANQKYPDYCEVGLQAFTELYDWHVRYRQPIEITRVDNRTALRFMFTWMVLVPNQDPVYIGIPYDRG
jgi:hypothetical protein